MKFMERYSETGIKSENCPSERIDCSFRLLFGAERQARHRFQVPRTLFQPDGDGRHPKDWNLRLLFLPQCQANSALLSLSRFSIGASL